MTAEVWPVALPGVLAGLAVALALPAGRSPLDRSLLGGSVRGRSVGGPSMRGRSVRGSPPAAAAGLETHGEPGGAAGSAGEPLGGRELREPVARMHRPRGLWSLLAGAAAATFVGGPMGVLGGVLAATGCWVAVGRAEPAHLRAEREQMRRDLPHVVRLLASALSAGVSPTDALAAVSAALPGAAAARLSGVASRLRLGADPAEVWRTLAEEPALAPLGRALVRAQVTGAPVAVTIERLADDLARAARADVEERARAVGVRAAVPLGLCLLPAFVLIGVVPLVGGLLAGLAL